MVSRMALRVPSASYRSPAALGLSSCSSKRCLSSVTARAGRFNQTARPVVTPLSRHVLQQSFRRGYADKLPPTPAISAAPVAPPKKKGFRVFRWLWRLTYISALAGVGYVGYVIWDLRTPSDQFEPAASKKTLVILGKMMARTPKEA